MIEITILIISVLANLLLMLNIIHYADKLEKLKNELHQQAKSFNIEKLQLISKLTLFSQIKVSNLGEVDIAEYEIIEKTPLNTVHNN
jgi:hypothetical protein